MKIKTLIDGLYKHDNDYGFNPATDLFSYSPRSHPSLSIIIPYYETSHLFIETLRHIYNAINSMLLVNPAWLFEVIVVDDGSKINPVVDIINSTEYKNIILKINSENKGRTITRNIGLSSAQYELCLFMDSDILIDKDLISNHLKAHSLLTDRGNKKGITVSFFEYTNNQDIRIYKRELITKDIDFNDYRLYCVYNKTWIGCEADKKFIGQEFSIIKDTNYFRGWNGIYKAWVLPNMVLGGFFVVNRQDALEVGGFNNSFIDYGFTETSLPTKLIAIKNHYLVPVLIGGGLHIEDIKINISKEEKNKIFKKKHNFYFNKYLKLSFDQAIHDKFN